VNLNRDLDPEVSELKYLIFKININMIQKISKSNGAIYL
jgi:hypothetical protein